MKATTWGRALDGAGAGTIPSRDNYTLRGWSINGLNTDVAEIDAAIDEAVAEGTWLVLTFHDLVGGAPGTSTEFNDDDFAEVADHVRAQQKEDGLEVRTVGNISGPAESAFSLFLGPWSLYRWCHVRPL